MSGPVAILGCPGSGKTYRAWHLALEESRRTGFPIIVIDSGRVDQFRAVPHAPTVRALVERVWGDGEHCAFTPETPEQFDKIAAAAREGRQAIILIDELKNVLPSSRSMSLPFQMAVRLWRHSELEGIYFTTQSYRDAARPLRAVISDWLFFRMVSPADLEDIRQDFGLDPVELANLPRYEYKRVSTGFQS